MPRGKDTKSISVNIPADMLPRAEALAAYRGVSVSAAFAEVMRDAVIRYEGGETRDMWRARNEARLASLEAKIDMILLLVWQGAGGEAVKATAADVARLRELVAELQA